MGKVAKISLIIGFIIIAALVLYTSFRTTKDAIGNAPTLAVIPDAASGYPRPYCALIFDDLGTSIEEIKSLYDLDIPLTISVFPEERFSKNVAYIGQRCGFSVLIHLPLEPKTEIESYRKVKKDFIGTHHGRQGNERLLRKYLNSIRIAMGVNNHMGSKATENPKIMRLVLSHMKRDNLVFVDSLTSLDSIACEVAAQVGVRCRRNDGFLDAVDDTEVIKEKIVKLIALAREKGKIIVIAHPRANTLTVLEELMPALKEQLQFVTLKDYLEL
ncbi:MAG: divergent polysaccharide deacetylase family protein [Candidatus Omnitrophica bacterium]|nr:divergent polysaccharide deacetylase family protein [Candidatus Omnitrophota bacterium]